MPRDQGHKQPTGSPAPAHPGSRPVDPQVFGHGRLLAEASATLRAGIGALPTVGTPVDYQLRALSEAAATVWARVRLLARVGTCVASQV